MPRSHGWLRHPGSEAIFGCTSALSASSPRRYSLHCTDAVIPVTFIPALRYLFFGGSPPRTSNGPLAELAPAVAPVSPIDVYDDHQVPSYPDAGTPLPSVHPQRLLEKHAGLVTEIQVNSGLDKNQFRDLLVPVLLRYAEIVHLLPASESHHHCGVGGLLRHGLEVARNAIVAAKGIEFALDNYPSERERIRPRWRVAIIVGGLCHDLGKPIIDIGATTADGVTEWNPHRESLWAWLERNQLKDYRLRWRTGARHKRHEWYNAVPLYRLIPPQTLDWLCEGVDQQPIDALVAALSGSLDTNNPMVDLLRIADSKSVERDLHDSRQRLAATALGGQRNLAARIIRTIHDQLDSNAWRCNRPGDLIWVTTEGIFAIFPAVIREAVAILREQGETGLPHDTSPILQMLADLGALNTHTSASGQQHYTIMVRYHTEDRRTPMVFDAQSIQFTGNDLIPRSMILPEPVKVEVARANKAPATTPAVPASPPPASPAAAAVSTPSAPQKPMQSTPEAEAPPTADQPSSATAAALHPATPQPVLVSSPPSTSNSVTAGAPAVEPEPLAPSPPASTTGPTAPAEDTTPLRDRSREPEVRDEMMRDAYEAMNGPRPPDTPQGAAQWFALQDAEGAWMLTIAERIGTGELQEGRDVFEVDDYIHLAVMTCLKNLGLEVAMVREAFEKRDWTLPDPNNPRRKTIDVDGPAGKRVNCIRLRHDIGKLFGLLLPARGAADMQHLERARRNNVRPLGPYLDSNVAANIRDLRSSNPSDGVWVRPGFHAFLNEVAGERGLPAVELTPKDLSRAITDFVSRHSAIEKPWLIFHLQHGDNPGMVKRRDERGREVFVVNPDYRFELDIKAQQP